MLKLRGGGKYLSVGSKCIAVQDAVLGVTGEYTIRDTQWAVGYLVLALRGQRRESSDQKQYLKV